MTITVVDGGNLVQELAYAGVEESEAKPEVKAEPKAEPEAKEVKADDKAEAKTEPAADDADDVEDGEGITTRQKRELSAQMLKAIGKKHRQMKEAEEFAAHQYRERQQAERRTNELEEEARRNRPQQAQEPVEPARENFGTEGEFIKASIKWGVDVGIREREAQMRVEANQTRLRASLTKAQELVPDFREVTQNAKYDVPGPVAEYMKESDMFAEIGYHFAKNPSVLGRLISLTPVRQLVELGKIEATLQPFGKPAKEVPEAGEEPKATKASTTDTGFTPSKARSDAPVIKPLTGGEGSVEPDVRTMDIRQSIEHYQKTQKVNLHARKRH